MKLSTLTFFIFDFGVIIYAVIKYKNWMRQYKWVWYFAWYISDIKHKSRLPFPIPKEMKLVCHNLFLVELMFPRNHWFIFLLIIYYTLNNPSSYFLWVIWSMWMWKFTFSSTQSYLCDPQNCLTGKLSQ